MSDVVWWTGAAVWTGLSGAFLWLLLTLAAEAFDATWFTCRCVFEGGTKNRSARNLLRIWLAGFWHEIYSVTASEGYVIVYPGYGRSEEGPLDESYPG